jgi:hypothetical protein
MNCVPIALLVALAGAWTAAAQASGDEGLDPRRGRLEERVEGLALRGDMAVLATSGGVVLMNIDRAERPRRLGALLLTGNAVTAWVEGTVALVPTGAEGLVVVDLAKPAAPREVGRLDTPGSAMDVTAAGSFRFLVADGSMGVVVADLSDPTRPRTLHTLDTGGYVRALALASETSALAAAGRGGLVSLRLTPEGEPAVAGLLESTDARAVLVEEGRAWLADGSGGLAAIDLDASGALREVSRLDLSPYEARDVVRSGRHLVVALGRGGLAVIRAGKESLRQVARLPLSRPAVELAASGSLVYVANDSGGLAVVDLSEPEAPRLVTPDPGA